MEEEELNKKKEKDNAQEQDEKYNTEEYKQDKEEEEKNKGNDNSNIILNKPIIKHLVISGGGPNGIKHLGIIQGLEKNEVFNMNNIESIYATSSGSILSVLLALRYDWETINDYIINRPWHETYKITADMIFNSYSKKGLFDESVVEIFYKPFFNAKDLSLNMTMREIYEYSGIDLHIFSLELNSFEMIDINYKTFPDIPVLKAVLMSSSIPILFCPVYFNNLSYIDGVVMCNYPLKYCIHDHPIKEEILAIKNKNKKNTNTDNIVDIINEMTILDYFIYIIGKIVIVANKNSDDEILLAENEIICEVEPNSFSFMKRILESNDLRKELLESGISSTFSTFQKG